MVDERGSSRYSVFTAPCKGCADRRVTSDYNCHSACERYQEYKDTIDARRMEIFAEKEVERGLNEAEAKRRIKAKGKYKWQHLYTRP